MSEALAAPPTRDGAIRVNLTLPVTRWGFGPFAFDPVEQLIGCPLTEILESLMVGPVYRRPSAAGPAVEVYPLALPDGEGACIPLGQFGETGFKAERGLLVLTVPWAAQNWVLQRFGDAVVAGPEQELSSDRSAWVAAFKVKLRPGMRASWPLGGFGEVGVEAG
ncbi:MAG: hypothetical protein H6740_29535 [Alphaproteobacteria bacterium]|nr:hypothetical protein [Alphaproteobacteria bacterium]